MCEIGAFHKNCRVKDCELDEVRSLGAGNPPWFGLEHVKLLFAEMLLLESFS